MEQNNQTSPDPAPAPQGGSGMGENAANLFCYLGFWVTGLIFLLLEKNRPTVRFHAAQSLIWFGGLQILSIVLGMSFSIFLYFLVDIIYLVWVISWVFLMYKGYQGGIYKLPYIGDLAERISKAQS